jgi:hypothetical protein
MANFKDNLNKLIDKDATSFMWQFTLGTALYVAVPSLVNKYLTKDGNKPPMDGILGLVTGLAATILVYLLTSWRGVLYAGYGHTIGEVTFWGARQVGIEPFNAFPENTQVTTTNDLATYINQNDYIEPPDFRYLPSSSSSVNDGVEGNVYDYSEFYH